MTRITTYIAALALLGLPGLLQAQDPAAVADGAGVWANNCVRCHNARPSTERTDAQWMVIVSHMRARANLTRTQARAVTAFLQATNLPEGVPPAADPEPPPETGSDGSRDGGSDGGRAETPVPVDGPESGLDARILERLLAYVARLRRP